MPRKGIAVTDTPKNAVWHGECGQWWLGVNRSHCSACHLTFTGESAADKHRVGSFGLDGDRRCLHPTEVGLEAREKPGGWTLWGEPLGDPSEAWWNKDKV